MKRILLTSAIALLLLPLLQAQSTEFGLFFGTSAYRGDLSVPNSGLSKDQFHPTLGLFGRYNVSRNVAARLSFSFGKLSGSDANATDENLRQRNLSFQSRLVEIGVVGEFHPLGFDPMLGGKRVSPYIFGGLALFHFKPETNFNGQLIELQPLGTEGQGMDGRPAPYELTQFALPFGVGIKMAISARLNIGVEAGLRKTFTDYIDDVSTSYVNYNDLARANGDLAAQLANRTGEYLGAEPVLLATDTQRGNPEAKDWYGIAGLSISYSFYRVDNGLASGKKGKNIGCPTF